MSRKGRTGAPRILVVEDSPTQAERLRLVLEGRGYRAEVAADGREGLRRVQAAPPDLIISDVVMPEMDGYAFCRAVKSHEETRRIPFVILTERNTPADLVKGLQHGADNFIAKPFDDNYLLERVRRILRNLELRRRGRLDMEVTVNVGNQKVVINTDKQQIFELLFATYEALDEVNDQLVQAQQSVQEYAETLETMVRERTRELERLREEAERRRKTAESLADVGRLISQSLDSQEVGRRIVDSVRRLLEAQASALFRLEPASGDLVVVTSSLQSGSFLAPNHVLPRGTGVIGLAVAERRAVATPDVLADPRVTLTAEARAAIEQAHYRSVLAVPLLVQGRVIGALGVGDRRGREFSDEEIRLLQAFADQAALALDNARLHEEATDARDFLRSIAENSADAIVTTDFQGRITYLSPGAEEMFGYPAQEVLGRPVGDYYWRGAAEAREVMKRLVAEGRIRNYETAFRASDGRRVEADASVSLLRDEKGATVGVLGVIKDVTERKRIQEELQGQRDAIYQREKLAAMGSMLAGVAHELNNPLSVILGQAALLRQDVGGGSLAERAERIARAAERSTRIVRNFLALARQRPPERQPVALNQVVEEAVELLAYPLRVDNVEVTLDLASDLPVLWGDFHQLHQLVVNLVSNGHHAMHEAPPPRRLILATRFDPAGKRILLTVADTGPGIPPDIRSRIFEPFFTTKPVGKGTGLGLSLCQGIAEGHGGSIRVESQPGQGATFLVELPVVAPPAPGPEARAAGPLPPMAGKTILAVDDEPEITAILAEILSADGHQVESAADGIEALDRLGERAFDLVLCDIRMPEVDGLGLYREVERRHPELLGRFVFLTGDTLSPELEEFFARTGAPWLSKPFEPEEILGIVERVLRALERGEG